MRRAVSQSSLLWGMTVSLSIILLSSSSLHAQAWKDIRPEYPELERLVMECAPDPRFPDDFFILVTLQEALAGIREGSGGIGACLVREATGEVVERGHNRQFSTHFRSDLHAEMDLLNRFEDHVRAQRNPDNPRRFTEGLILYTSLEPCPMCLARILNSGIKKVFHAAPDPIGGMADRISCLPPFWKEMAAGRVFGQARCSPRLTELAVRLLGPYAKMWLKRQSSSPAPGSAPAPLSAARAPSLVVFSRRPRN